MKEDLSGVISLDVVVLAGVEEVVLTQHHLEGQLGERDRVGAVRQKPLPAVVDTVAGSQDVPGQYLSQRGGGGV